MKNNFGNNSPVLNIYNKSNLKSKIDTQLLYGDNFRITKKNKNWKKITNVRDGYKGFIKSKKFPAPIKDAQRAVRYIRYNAVKFKRSPPFFFVETYPQARTRSDLLTSPSSLTLARRSLPVSIIN